MPFLPPMFVLELRLILFVFLLADATARAVQNPYLHKQRQLLPPAHVFAFIANTAEGSVCRVCRSGFAASSHRELRGSTSGCSISLLGGCDARLPSGSAKKPWPLWRRPTALHAFPGGEMCRFLESDDQVEVRVPLDGKVKAADIEMNVTERSLRVGLKNHKPFLEGVLKGRVVPSKCMWFLEDEVPVPTAKQGREPSDVKRLTVVLRKQSGGDGSSPGIVVTSPPTCLHWSQLFERAEAGDPLTYSSFSRGATLLRQSTGESTAKKAQQLDRVPGELLLRVQVPPFPEFQKAKDQIEKLRAEQRRRKGTAEEEAERDRVYRQLASEERRVFHQHGLALLDAWVYAGDPATLTPLAAVFLSRHSKLIGGSEFGCPLTALFIHAEPLPDGVSLLFGPPHEFQKKTVFPPDGGGAFGSSGFQETGAQGFGNGCIEETWPREEGVDLRIVAVQGREADKLTAIGDEAFPSEHYEILAIRRSVGTAALRRFGPGVAASLADSEARLLQKLQSDLAKLAFDARDPEAREKVARERMSSEESEEKFFEEEYRRLNTRIPEQNPKESTDGIADSNPQTPFSPLRPSPRKLVEESKGQPESSTASLSTSYPTEESQKAQKTNAGKDLTGEASGVFDGKFPLLDSSASKTQTRKWEQFGIKLLDLNKEGMPVPQGTESWTPEERREYQKEAATTVANAILEARADRPVLEMTDVVQVLQKQLNCTDAEFQEVWRGGFDHCGSLLNKADTHSAAAAASAGVPFLTGGVSLASQQASFSLLQEIQGHIDTEAPFQTNAGEEDPEQKSRNSRFLHLGASAARAGQAAAEAAIARGATDFEVEKAAEDAAFKQATEETETLMREGRVLESRLDGLAGPGLELAPPSQINESLPKEEEFTHRKIPYMTTEELRDLRRTVEPQITRFRMLLRELTSVDESSWLDVCEHYKDFLVEPEYMTVMTLFLFDLSRNTGDSAVAGIDSSAEGLLKVSSESTKSSSDPQNVPGGPKLQYALEKEVERSHLFKCLAFIHRFVVSLYEDIAALAAANEKAQLQKIRLLCMQALHDETKLNEYAESMRPLFDRDFFTYLIAAINEERRRIGKQGINPDAAPSNWLLVLLIIQKGVLSIFEKEIRQDVYDIAFIVSQRQPDVRRVFVEKWIAKIPKSDWKQFKLLVNRLAERFAKGDYFLQADWREALIPTCTDYKAEGFVNYPWIPAATLQLQQDLERILPDWFIEGMLSSYDRKVMQMQMLYFLY